MLALIKATNSKARFSPLYKPLLVDKRILESEFEEKIIIVSQF